VRLDIKLRVVRSGIFRCVTRFFDLPQSRSLHIFFDTKLESKYRKKHLLPSSIFITKRSRRQFTVKTSGADLFKYQLQTSTYYIHESQVYAHFPLSGNMSFVARSSLRSLGRRIPSAMRKYTTHSQLPEEHRMVYEMCRKFADEELAPHAGEWDKKHEFPKEAVTKLVSGRRLFFWFDGASPNTNSPFSHIIL